MCDFGPPQLIFWESHRKYAHEVLKHARTWTCKPATTPADSNHELSPDYGLLVVDPTHYDSLVSVIQYFIFTHPNIANVVQQVRLFYACSHGASCVIFRE